jgi:hypothetical protein
MRFVKIIIVLLFICCIVRYAPTIMAWMGEKLW